MSLYVYSSRAIYVTLCLQQQSYICHSLSTAAELNMSLYVYSSRAIYVTLCLQQQSYICHSMSIAAELYMSLYVYSSRAIYVTLCLQQQSYMSLYVYSKKIHPGPSPFSRVKYMCLCCLHQQENFQKQQLRLRRGIETMAEVVSFLSQLPQTKCSHDQRVYLPKREFS